MKGGNWDDENDKKIEYNNDELVLSVSEALRLLPSAERDETGHTGLIKLRGMISSVRPVIKMVSGEYAKCPKCEVLDYERYEKPKFEYYEGNRICGNIDSNKHEVVRDPKTDKIMYDKDGCMIRERVFLKAWAEYRNALIIELQDQEKFDDLERLQVILFDDNTNDVRAGEQVLVTGEIYFEKFSKMESKINSRLYSHSIVYEARREISLSSMDVNAIKRFVARHGNRTVDKLVYMFAPKVIGFYNIKKGLLLCAASCCNDSKKPRVRMHSLLVGDPGQAKSMLARGITDIVPNSRFESAQNSSGKSLTAIVSKEGKESSTVLRLGPIPFAKEAICGLNELGRMSFDDQAPLLDVMEEGEFTINKHGFNARIRSPTVIIGSANPTGSKWSNLSSDGRINLDDIPAIKPLVDRFDFMFVVKTSRDEQMIREYANAKSKYEDLPIPNYNTYLEKHLIFSKRFNPKMSSEATIMLNEYYVEIAKIAGSPRVRDTIFKTAKMISRLKLRNVVDAEDAKEACQFYNIILNEYDHIVNIPSNPQENAVTECLYIIEAAQAPISFEDTISKTCERDDYISTYIGSDHKIRSNKKLRIILDRLLEHSQIERVQIKPTILKWIPKEKDRFPNKEENDDDHHYGNDNSNANSSSDVTNVTNVTNVTRLQLHTKVEKRSKKVENESSSDNVARSHKSHRSHRIGKQSKDKTNAFDIDKILDKPFLSSELLD
jgi:DNA replicative helicase MCM subunit Mcm2 (Cdc46/Mcm family)